MSVLVPIALASSALTAGCLLGGDTEPGPASPPQWLVLKCKLSGVDALPEKADQQINAVLNGTEGAAQYFHDISYGKYAPEFVVHEWVTQKETLEGETGLSRRRRIDNCIRAHSDAGNITGTGGYEGVIVFRNVSVDSGASGDVLLDIGAWNPTFAAHEMGHRLGLHHSWDTSDRLNSSWSQPGEYYDFWDIMSAMAVYDFSNIDGQSAGPDMATSFKLKLGWMDEQDLRRESLERLKTTQDLVEVVLNPYSRPGGLNPLAAVITTGTASTDSFYTVEYRTKSGWDRAIPKPGVLIHRVDLQGDRPYVMPGGTYQAGQSFTSDQGLKIEIVAFDDQSATVRLSYSGKPAGVTGRPGTPSENPVNDYPVPPGIGI